MKERLKAIYYMWGAFAITLIISLVLLKNSETTRNTNTLITIGFFVIVFLIFLYTTFRFLKLKKIVNDIKKATATINFDYTNNNQTLLWERYKNRGNLFTTAELNAAYKSFIEENNRLNDVDDFGVYGDIEKYIDYSIIDSSVKKSVVNLVSGTMTGLGILGTFIGLSFGLRSFSTGTTEEISQSIAPLMEGIKVAFHTSIYGMLLSLMFGLNHMEILMKNKSITSRPW